MWQLSARNQTRLMNWLNTDASELFPPKYKQVLLYCSWPSMPVYWMSRRKGYIKACRGAMVIEDLRWIWIFWISLRWNGLRVTPRVGAGWAVHWGVWRRRWHWRGGGWLRRWRFCWRRSWGNLHSGDARCKAKAGNTNIRGARTSERTVYRRMQCCNQELSYLSSKWNRQDGLPLYA